MQQSDKPIHKFYIGCTDEGKYAATSLSSPYFFFEAETEAEAIATATRAFHFYSGGPCMVAPVPRKRPEQPRLSRFTKKRQETCVAA